MTGVTSVAETAYPARAHEYNLRFSGVHVVQLNVLTILVPCRPVHYDFRMKTIFCSYLLPFILYGVQVLVVFIYVYWCPTWIPHHMLFVSFNSYTRGATLVEQELPTFPARLSSPPAFSGVHVAQCVAFCVVFLDHCPFFFWPLYYMSVLRFMASDYPFWYFQTYLGILV
jgi:hypothetical protein